MSTNEVAAGAGAPPVAQAAPAEPESTDAAAPKSFAPGQTVCNEKNEKGKLCNGHLKQTNTAGEDALKHLRGEDVLYRCQSCGALYMGPPLGHVRDPRTQTRFVERELMDILNAAGGTLPAFRLNERGAYVPAGEAAHGHATPAKPAAATPAAATPAAATPAATPAEPEETPEQKRARKKAEAEARKASAVPIPGAAGPPPEGETPEQKLERLKAVVAEAKRRKEAAAAGAPLVPTDVPPAAPPPPSPTSGTDSSASADAHRPAAEAQAATGVASAAPLSSAAATASPAAGAESAADLAPDAPTEPAPAAPKAAKPAGEGGSHSGFKVPPELLPRPGETQEQKLARLRATVEAAKRAAGKL